MGADTIIINNAVRMMSNSEIAEMADMTEEEFIGHIKANPKSRYMSDDFLKKLYKQIKERNIKLSK